MKPKTAIKLCSRQNMALTITPNKIIIEGIVKTEISTKGDTLGDVCRKLRMFEPLHDGVTCVVPESLGAHLLIPAKSIDLKAGDTRDVTANVPEKAGKPYRGPVFAIPDLDYVDDLT